MHSILIVEDDEDLLYLYRTVLERGGFETVETFDAAEAIAQLQYRTFDIIILDLQMPEHPGVELLDYLAQNPHHNLEVIVITANDHMAQEVRERGVEHILIKPVGLFDVKNLIERILGG